MLPRRRVDAARRRDDVQRRAARRARRSCAVLARRAPGSARSRPAPGSRTRTRSSRSRSGRAATATPRVVEAALHRQRAPGICSSSSSFRGDRGRVGHHDLAAVGHVDEELVGDERRRAARRPRSGSGRRGGRSSGRAGAAALSAACSAVVISLRTSRSGVAARSVRRSPSADDLVLAGLERQVEHREREHHLEEAAAGLGDVRREERRAGSARRRSRARSVGLDDVGRRLLAMRAVPVVVLAQRLRRVDARGTSARDRVALARRPSASLLGVATSSSSAEQAVRVASFVARPSSRASAASAFCRGRASSWPRPWRPRSSARSAASRLRRLAARRVTASLVFCDVAASRARAAPSANRRAARVARDPAARARAARGRGARAAAARAPASRCASRMLLDHVEPRERPRLEVAASGRRRAASGRGTSCRSLLARYGRTTASKNSRSLRRGRSAARGRRAAA